MSSGVPFAGPRVFLRTQFLFGLMPKFIFPGFRPAVALPDIIGAIEDLLFRGAFHAAFGEARHARPCAGHPRLGSI